MTTVLSFMSDRNPSTEHAALRNSETGVTASNEVNVHKRLEVGQKKDVFQLSFRRSKQVKTLNEKSKSKYNVKL